MEATIWYIGIIYSILGVEGLRSTVQGLEVHLKGFRV